MVYETDWQKQQKEELLYYHDFMVRYLKEDYPELYKKLTRGSASGTLNMVLDIARMYVLDRDLTSTGISTFVYPLGKFAKDAEY